MKNFFKKGNLSSKIKRSKESSKNNIHDKLNKIEIKPKFLVVGLIAIITIISLIYFIFLKYSPIMNFKYEGYAISGKQITDSLLGTSNDGEEKNLELVKIEEQGTIFKKLNSYFVGNKEKKEINLNYPIYIIDKNTIYNLNQDMVLISKDFEKIAGYPNLSISEGRTYDGNNLERADEKEYIFAQNKDGIYINLKEIKISTTANEYVIPANSLISFEKEAIRYYSIQENILVFNEIKDVDDNSKTIIKNIENKDKNNENSPSTQIVEKIYSYKELLTKLGIIENAENDVEKEEKEEIIKEDTSEEQKENDKEEIVTPEKEEEKKEEENNSGYKKPEVTVEEFTAEVYSAKSTLNIKDEEKRIVEAPTFEVYKDGKKYIRRVFKNSGDIQITGLVPETEYEIIGKYIYLNEEGKKVENTFYKGKVKTKGYEELGKIELSKEEGEIYSNKIQIKNVKITSDLNAEVIKGINQIELETGKIRTVLKNNQVNDLLQGKEITIESSEGLQSNREWDYEIKFYDKNGIELSISNNNGKTKTAKQKPTARITTKNQDIVSVTLDVKLNNKDNANLKNYKYIITKPNGEIVKEERLAEDEREILLENLDQNQYYKIAAYADYDLEDNKGKQKEVEIGNLVFATKPISTLGLLELKMENKELASTSTKIDYKIDEERTDKRLIQILNGLQIIIKENNDGKSGNIAYKHTLTEEEILVLKRGEANTIKCDNLKPNTTYEIEITGNIKLGKTEEDIPITYTYKEFTTLKIPAKILIQNQFVTGNLIDFDIKVEDINNSILNNKVRMELRDEKANLLDLQEITTNEDYIRKTYDKLIDNHRYKLSFYADQYNVGSTDETYKVNYLIKEIEIITEPGISGSIGLTDLTKKATGKNLIDMSSDIKWYVYPNFNTGAYYGKEYNAETKILQLGGYDEYRRAVYDLKEYAGQEVTMSFKARAVKGAQSAYIQNSKRDTNRTRIQNLTEEWQDYQCTLKLDTTGYLGFFIEGGNGIEVKELQVELGNRKTNYEEFKNMLQSNFIVNLVDEKNEITTNDYYIKIYKEDELVQEERYEEIPEDNIVKDSVKTYKTETGNKYTIQLSVKIKEREYVLSEIEYSTKETEEIKGIYNLNDFLEIQPNGNYIVLNDLDFTGTSYCLGYEWGGKIQFNGRINFNGHKVITDVAKDNKSTLIAYLGTNGIIENLEVDIAYNNAVELSSAGYIIKNNYGTIRNIKVNVVESNRYANTFYSIIADSNYGVVDNFIVNFKEIVYVKEQFGTVSRTNRGVIKNGYIYGKNINTDFKRNSGTGIAVGGIVLNNEKNGQIKNVYSLVSIDVSEQEDIAKNVGNIVYNNTENASIENVYSVGLGKNITSRTSGPNIYYVGGKVSNNFYFNDEIFNNKYHKKTTMLALHDTKFQEQILNSENSFNVEEYVSKGYYPQIKMPNIMSNNEYIPLPEVEDADLADILSTEVIEQGTDTVKVKFNVYNPSAETITNIKIKNVDCTILSQTYENKRSEVIAKLHSPKLYISVYSVLGITTQGAFNIPYTREFLENERTIEVDLYKKINTIADWQDINKSPTENYILMQDLNFANMGTQDIITKTFTGKLDGNFHKISNIKLENDGGLFKDLRGEINNLNIENYSNEKVKTDRVGLVEYLKGGTINNTHINKLTIKMDSAYKGYINCAGIVAYSETGTVKNSSVSNLYIESEAEGIYTAIGGIIANSSGSSISNCFVQNINFKVNKTMNSKGIGGICGYDSLASNIVNCYSVGNIEADTSNIGGIIGFGQNGRVKSCYSMVNIVTDGEYIAGIVGNDRETILNNNINNLAIGNIYSKQITETVSRAVGNSKEEENNYAYKMQRFNGNISDEKAGAILVSIKELQDKNFYESKIKLGNAYNYDNVKEGYVPKLLDTEGIELLPNQIDNKLQEDLSLEIEEVEANKTSSNIVKMRVVINNPKEVKITNISIDDMDSKIDTVITKDRKTYVNITATPTRYYDSYRISKIKYIKDNVEKEKQVEGRVEIEFYKEIYTYEDWTEIGTDTYENYKLMADINFENKDNIKTNLAIRKLEGNGHKLRNIKLVLKESNSGLIKLIKTKLNDIVFENINIVNSASGEKTGVIANSNATIENITMNNVTINAPKINKVGFIGNSTSEEIKNITMDTMEVIGNSNVAGLAGGSDLPILRDVEAKNLNVVGSGNHIGGVLSNPTKRIGYNIKNITVSNSHIQGADYVGGLFSYLNGGGDNGTQEENLNSIKNQVIGKSYVGGVAGTFMDSTRINSESVIVKGEGNYIGGVAGVGGNSWCTTKDSIIEGTTSNSNYVGGIFGKSSWDSGYDYGINNTVISKGSNVGGLYGEFNIGSAGGTTTTYNKGGSVIGYSNVGGITGYSTKGYTKRSYTDTNITAISHNAGGIIGCVLNQSMDANSIGINNCYVANSTIKAQKNVGGIVGSFSNSLGEGVQYFYNNYVHADITSDNIETASLGFGKQKSEIVGAKNIYVYKYATVNGERVSTENDKYILPANYLAGESLKQESTYKQKIGWGTNYVYTTLKEGKYPIINGVSNQEGILLPTDPVENMLNENDSESLENNTISGDNNKNSKEDSSTIKEEKLQYTFNYQGKTIKTYETYSIITDEKGNEVKRNYRLYVKDEKLYALPDVVNEGASNKKENVENINLANNNMKNLNTIKLVANNFVIDSYNGKEYVTVLGENGKLYDLKEPLNYPEKFVNKNIASIGNNLNDNLGEDSENSDNEKTLHKYEIEVVYKNGDTLRFNYQTGELINSSKLENSTNKGVWEYIKEKTSEIGNFMGEDKNNKNMQNKYEESIKLQNKLEEAPVEEALQLQNRNVNVLEGSTATENEEANNSLKEQKYISIYNKEKDDYQIYQEEELLNTSKQEVISENEKIEANNLKEYYASEGKAENTKMGIVWIVLSIIGVVIILFAMKKRD